MPKTKISEFSATPANNTDIDSINIAEGCAPSGINDAIRELMAQLKDFQTGAVGDSFNGPVGTTTAAAGAFTTLSASGAVTLSGGTANGVTYLNGSKVVTSGSALTFDGTLLTVASSTPKIRLSDSGLANDFGIDFYFPSIASSYGQVTLNGSTGGMRFVAGKSGSSGYYQAFELNGSEGMRLTSTGLGIGTSSPDQALVVNKASGSTYVKVSGANNVNNDLAVQFTDGTNTSFIGMMRGSSGGVTGALHSYTGGAIRSTLDSSGNLGLGVTPSAWGSGWRGLQNGNASFASATGYTAIGQNWYTSSTADTYITSNYATRYYQNAGQHIWNTAPSGTAGDAITFTQALTLDASGNLLVGTTTARNKLTVQGTVFSTPTLGTASGNAFFGEASGYGMMMGTSGFGYGWIQQQRVDGSATAYDLLLQPSGGNLLVGTTSAYASSKLTVSTAGSNGIANVQTSSGGYCFISNAASNAGTFYHASFEENTTQRGSITSNGTVTAYNTTSDYRLKNITGALTGYKERLMSLQPKQGTWKADGSEFRGFLAHEFAQPYRASVTGEKDAVDAEGKPIMQAMQASSSEVMADLVAMVNELITENVSLKARLDAANL